MRKLHTLIAGASAAAVIALACPALNAQTSFEASNDPSATIVVEPLDTKRTAVSITRLYREGEGTTFSARTVLRDPVSGIAYPLLHYRTSISKDGRFEIVQAIFRGFDEPVERFDLIDPRAQQQALYISRITTSEVITASLR